MVSGAALVAQRLAEGLAARGHSVLVIAASDRGAAYSADGAGVRQVRLPSVSNLLRAGQRVVLWSHRRVAAALREFQPDVLHLHDPSPLGLSGLRIAHALGIPVVLTLHQLPWFVAAYVSPALRPIVESGLWAYYAGPLRRCNALVTPSHTIADRVQARGFRRPLVISNGVDLQRFSPCPATADEDAALRHKYGLASDLPVILYVGRLDVDKQVALVVRAAARAMRDTAAQLLVVGGGTERAALIELSRQLGIEDRSHFPGYVPLAGELPGLYRLATVFVTASEIEIQSSVVLEAAASGLPVVTVRASSMPEFVRDGETGYLVPPRDIEMLAERLVRLLREPDRARAMGQAGRALAEQHSPTRSLEAHQELYRRLIAERSAVIPTPQGAPA
jgi:glycosyltransferase involved in cell wall biosynthesis